MAGIEPASERIDPRTSTSLSVCSFSPNLLQMEKVQVWPAAGARKPLFHTFSSLPCGTPTFCRPVYLRSENGVGGRDPILGSVCSYSLLTQQEEEQHIQCGWHFSFALILRVRRLSACSPGSASSVEASHPRVSKL